MKIQSISEWNERFFDRFIEFRNRMQADIYNSFPEDLSDYKKYFAPDSPFASDYLWEAFVVEDNDVILAKAILCWKKNTKTGNLGFIDWENNLPAARMLIDAVMASAKKNSIKHLKTPVDMNFYVKYRIKLPGGGDPFWGEPVYPDYYHNLFKETGFTEVGLWDTYRLHKIQVIIDYFLKRKKLAAKPTGSHSKTKDKSLRTTIRCVNIKDWDNELRIIYKLFNQAYQNMPEWESVTFEQFKLVYDDFKYMMNPYYSYIIEFRGQPVGFSINFVDPLSILAKVKGKKLSTFQKVILLMKLRMNFSTFIIAHIGKIPGPNGEEIKGVQIQASKRIQFVGFFMPKVLVTFQMKDSPSRRSFKEKTQDAYSQYVLYGQDLE